MVKLGMVDPMVGFANMTMALGHPPSYGARVAVHRSLANAAGRRSMRHRRAPRRIRSDLDTRGFEGHRRQRIPFGWWYVSTPLKNIRVSQLGVLFLIHEKKRTSAKRHQTTNQINISRGDGTRMGLGPQVASKFRVGW